MRCQCRAAQQLHSSPMVRRRHTADQVQVDAPEPLFCRRHLRKFVGHRRTIAQRRRSVPARDADPRAPGAILRRGQLHGAIQPDDAEREVAHLRQALQVDAVHRMDGQPGPLHDDQPDQQDEGGAGGQAAWPEDAGSRVLHRRRQHVAAAAHRLDELGVAPVILQLAAQAGDGNVDRAVERPGLPAPQQIQQHVAG